MNFERESIPNKVIRQDKIADMVKQSFSEAPAFTRNAFREHNGFNVRYHSWLVDFTYEDTDSINGIPIYSTDIPALRMRGIICEYYRRDFGRGFWELSVE